MLLFKIFEHRANQGFGVIVEVVIRTLSHDSCMDFSPLFADVTVDVYKVFDQLFKVSLFSMSSCERRVGITLGMYGGLDLRVLRSDLSQFVCLVATDCCSVIGKLFHSGHNCFSSHTCWHVVQLRLLGSNSFFNSSALLFHLRKTLVSEVGIDVSFFFVAAVKLISQLSSSIIKILQPLFKVRDLSFQHTDCFGLLGINLSTSCSANAFFSAMMM